MTKAGPATSIDLPEREFYRKLLSQELSAARDAAEMTQKKMAKEMAWSISKIVRIEQGSVGVSPSDVRAIGSLLNLPDKKIAELIKYSHAERESFSWKEYEDELSPDYLELISLESKATRIYKYESGVIPGLVQTFDYMQALFEASGFPPEKSSSIVDVRQRRQTILEQLREKDDGPELNFVIGELALIRVAGGADVMIAQIEHLLQLNESDRVTVLLMPISAGVHIGLGVPFTILQFKDSKIGNILYTDDGFNKTAAEEDPEKVAGFLENFRRIEETADRSGDFEAHAHRILKDTYGVTGPRT